MNRSDPPVVRMAPPPGTRSECQTCGALVDPTTAAERAHATRHPGAVRFRSVAKETR